MFIHEELVCVRACGLDFPMAIPAIGKQDTTFRLFLVTVESTPFILKLCISYRKKCFQFLQFRFSIYKPLKSESLWGTRFCFIIRNGKRRPSSIKGVSPLINKCGHNNTLVRNCRNCSSMVLKH